MSKGVDVHCYYQRGFNFATAKAAGYDFAYVKVSDGGARYTKTVGGLLYLPQTQVDGAKAAGMLVGGYHYAEPSPSPEAQADVLTAEVRRLGALGLPPALDLEAPFTPGQAAKDFALRFLRRLKANGFNQVTVYGYTAMFGAIRPDLWDIPGLVIWVSRPAQAGSYKNSYYSGRADIHQFDSTGVVGGVSGVDLNVTLTDFISNGGTPDVELTTSGVIKYPYQETGEVMEVGEALGFSTYIVADMAKDGSGVRPTPVPGVNPVSIPDLHRKIDELAAKQAAPQPVAVDLDQLADKVTARIGNSLAQAVAEELQRRLAA